ncbi:MAG TPA: hypothetical protein VFY30_07465 [Solirubrobacterales bacterium]|nr:hypothetical protein [Solirubrobacterales bacterium]
MTRIRPLIALAFALVAALVIAACGGGGNGEDPHQVLQQTFNNPTSIQSGTFDLDFKIETSGGDSPGSFETKLGGKFASQGSGQFPKFDVDASVKAESGSQSFSGTGGLISTGDGALVNFQGTDYAVPQQLYDEFTATYAQLQRQNSSGKSTDQLKALNISPANWLTDLKNEGTEDVEGTETIHISGSVNVSKLVEDLKAIAQRAGNAVGKVNTQQLDQLNDIVQSGDIDVYSGESDKLLRRFQIHVDLKPPAGTPGAPDSLSIDVQLNFADLNKPQTFNAPANAQPLSSLFQTLGINPSQLGNALRGGLGTSGALPQSGGSTTAPSPSGVQAYEQCLSKASGSAALQKCADLLGQ